jgi:flavin-dependent dehydrogenase
LRAQNDPLTRGGAAFCFDTNLKKGGRVDVRRDHCGRPLRWITDRDAAILEGYRVLLVDKASFPSDVVNGYYLQQHAVARLRRWGLLDRLRNSNCLSLYTITFDFGHFSLSGSPPPADDVLEGYAPRRIVLDKILVDAAVDAGAELREGFPVETLVWDGDRVVGIRSHTKSGVAVSESARIVIGADGPNSVVARSVSAQTYNVAPTLTCWYFSHWSGVPTAGVEFYLRDRWAMIACYTNDGLTADRLPI